VSHVRRTLSIAALISLIAVLLGTGPAPRDANAHYCAKAGEIRFRAADRTRLAGHRFGRGTTAVVFAHERRGGACDWIQYARRLARLGYLTIVFDFRGYGASQPSTKSRFPADVIAAAKLSRSLGAKRVVLVGASMGGTSVLVAAANARPAVDRVVAVSAPSFYGDMNGVAAVGKLGMPVLYLAGDEDDGFADESRTLYAATGSNAKTLEILNSSSHGVRLALEPGPRSLIERFIASR
jgi:pimeloyl-ACP methyl ester carboxylesterase